MRSADQLEAEVAAEYRLRGVAEPAPGDYVLVLGHSCAGKTSTVRRVAEATRGYVCVYDSALLSSDRFLDYTRRLFEEQDPAYYFPYEVEAVLVRFLQNRTAGRQTLCDQGPHSVWAYARALHHRGDLDDRRYETFYALFLTLNSLAPAPRLVVRFHCDAMEARRRVESRGRAHEQVALSAEFISDLDRAYERVVLDFPPSTARALIDTSRLTPTEAAERFTVILDAHTAR